MKTLVTTLTLVMALSLGATVQAADTLATFSIQDALNNPKIKAKLKNIKLYWGGQSHPKISKDFGEFQTSQRSNAFGKSRESACQWALLSSILRLQDRALREGGNAVVNLRSNIENVEFASETEYKCLAGTMMVNVALKGEVVKLAE